MRVIIAGPKGVTDPALLEWLLSIIIPIITNITEIVCGDNKVIDVLSRNWAIAHKIAYREFSVEGHTRGNTVWMAHNNKMADYADVLVAVYNGRSRRILHLVDEVGNRKKPNFVYDLTDASVTTEYI